MADWRIIEGDCVEQMAAMPEESVDAVVCDPPYGLEFMGKEWDKFDARATGGFQRGGLGTNVAGRVGPTYVAGHTAQQWHEAWAREALRVLKPGGHLLAFGGTRTYHRLACAIEDAGFEIRDTIAWLYGSGFPKSLDVSAAIDKAAGAEREVVGANPNLAGRRFGAAGMNTDSAGIKDGRHTPGSVSTDAVTAPATPDAERWQGWGTALKPAHEPIVVARKPLAGTVAGNVLATGCGALNVDGCRIAGDVPQTVHGVSSRQGEVYGKFRDEPEPSTVNPAGRWPANVVLDPEAAAMLDEQTGELTSGKVGPDGFHGPYRAEVFGRYAENRIDPTTVYGDSGGASRFFYVAKASSAERNAGLDGFEAQKRGSNFGMDGARPHTADDYKYEARDARNVHPTVKPIDLMRWLVRLVCPPGGLVLDPFAGSGTTGAAAVLEGFRFVGIERESEYAAIARARIAWWAEHPDGVEIVKALEAERTRTKVRESGQESLFG